MVLLMMSEELVVKLMAISQKLSKSLVAFKELLLKTRVKSKMPSLVPEKDSSEPLVTWASLKFPNQETKSKRLPRKLKIKLIK